MDIKKAVITAAGKNQRTLPLQTLVDRDGKQKTALRIIVEEALNAGIEEICVVVSPGDEKSYETAAGAYAKRLSFCPQPDARGYGHAVYCAREFTGREQYLLLVGDHLYSSREKNSCAWQLIQVATREACAISAVQSTHESKLPYYGTVGGRLVAGRQRLYQIENVMEKPAPTQAEQRLIVPGLRAGHYLCFFGMHVLSPAVTDILAELVHETKDQPVHLTAALALLARRERYLAYEIEGRRYDIGVKYGLFLAQLALAIDGQDREIVLMQLVDLLAQKTLTATSEAKAV